jgi:hypothetical protein
MIMKSHSYFRTKMLYLTENTYKHFKIRGIEVLNDNLNKKKSVPCTVDI